jgi:PAS domain S-box-containing protein
MSLSRRLVLLCVLAVLPAAGIQLWSELAQRQRRTAEIMAEAERVALYAASELDRIIEGTRQLLTAVGQAPSVVTRETERCSRFIGDIERGFPAYARFSVADRGGRLLCVAGGVPEGFGLAELPYFQEAVATGRFTLGRYMVGRLGGRQLLPMALPFAGADGTLDRVAVAAIDLEWLSAQLQERGLPPGGSVTVADRDGTIVARAPSPERFVGTRIPDAFHHLLHAPRPGALEVLSQDGTRRVLGYVPLPHPPAGLYVSAGLSTEAAFAAIDRATTTGFLLIGAGLLSALLAALVAGRLFLAPPIQRLFDAMRRWREGDTAARVGPISGGSDLARLAAGFDAMADALTARTAALEASEERLRLATEAAGLGVWEADLVESSVRWSPELFAMFGLDPGSDGPMTRARSLALIHPDDRALVREAWGTALRGGVFSAEFRGLRQGAGEVEERWILSRGRITEGRRGRMLIGVNLDITERRQAEDRLRLLAREVDHRAKNALAVVQAALRLTPREEAGRFAQAVEGRVAALARAQTLLAADRWTGAELRALIEGELAPFRGAGQAVELDGPRVLLPPGVTQPLAMAVHELATNAVKHGALSVPEGRVSVTWRMEEGKLRLRWVERGGPPLDGPPERRGFGSRVLEGTVRGQLGGAVRTLWGRDGLVCEVDVALRAVAEPAAAD